MNKYALALAVLGNATVVSACASRQGTSHVTETPTSEAKAATASCGASGSCGATKGGDKQAEQEASCGAAHGAEGSCGATSESAAASSVPVPEEQAASSSSRASAADANVATPAPQPGQRPAKKAAGAQGGCGEGSCA